VYHEKRRSGARFEPTTVGHLPDSQLKELGMSWLWIVVVALAVIGAIALLA
jgi:hypothetical protein